MSVSYPIPRLRTLLWRGCRRKCPQCGQGDVFKRFATLNDRCSVCGLEYLPDQGDLWGILLFADRAMFIIPVILFAFFWPITPSVPYLLVAGALVAFILVYTLPHRLAINLSIDYLVRRNSGDLVDEEPPKP